MFVSFIRYLAIAVTLMLLYSGEEVLGHYGDNGDDLD